MNDDELFGTIIVGGILVAIIYLIIKSQKPQVISETGAMLPLDTTIVPPGAGTGTTGDGAGGSSGGSSPPPAGTSPPPVGGGGRGFIPV
jgi:hypothetical protein